MPVQRIQIMHPTIWTIIFYDGGSRRTLRKPFKSSTLPLADTNVSLCDVEYNHYVSLFELSNVSWKLQEDGLNWPDKSIIQTCYVIRSKQVMFW